MRGVLFFCRALVLAGLAGAMGLAGAADGDFSECFEYSKAINANSPRPMVSEDGLRADWDLGGGKSLGCRVDAQRKLVSLIAGNREIPRNDLVKVVGPERGRIEHSDSKDAAFITKAEQWLLKILRDPASARFEDVYLAGGVAPVICGTVNAKNAHGGYTGFKRFFFADSVGLNEIESSPDSVFLGMFQKMCSTVRKPVQLMVKAQNTPSEARVSIADELKKLHELLQQGVLTKSEYEAQKKRLLQ